MKHIGILLAAGSSTRMKQQSCDKLLIKIRNKNAFRFSYEAFLHSNIIDNVIIVYRDEDQKTKLTKEIEKSHDQYNRFFKPIFTKGGKERMDSVENALSSCPSNTDFVYVHDCARPMLKSSTLDQLKKKTLENGAAVLARPMNDTVKRISDYNSNKQEDTHLTENIDRSRLWIMETPQCAKKSWLDNGIKKALKNKVFATDEISLLELINKKVTLVDPGYANPKLTTTKDLDYINFLLSNK